MASILAILLNNKSGLPTPQVYTYASPKPDDLEFAQGYDSVIKQESYENYLDLAECLFFRFQSGSSIYLANFPCWVIYSRKQKDGVHPSGKGYYIERSGVVVRNTAFLEDVHIGEITINLLKDNTRMIVDAHAICVKPVIVRVDICKALAKEWFAGQGKQMVEMFYMGKYLV